MGGGRFDSMSYGAYTSTMRGKTTDEVFTSRTINNNLNPRGVLVRESRDSADNPNSTPLIVALDVTGSMGMLADRIAREGLGTLFTGVLEDKPISDPHVMFMGVGDANCDQFPLQVSQFEADNRIVEQLAQLYLEGGGGGNDFESYNLPWYFAAYHTAIDSMIKRGKRGYLFTVGDEQAPADLTAEQIKRVIGDEQPLGSLKTADLLEAAQGLYDVYHIVIEQGSHASRYLPEVMRSWTPLLSQRVIRLSDYTKLAEMIISVMQVAEGADAGAVASKWGVAADAIRHVPRSPTAGLIGRAS